MKLVFATHNLHKFNEVKAMFPKTTQLFSLPDIGCTSEIPETADTIEGNAILKANYVRDRYDLDCFADDTGLEVAALNNAPGVHSARYAGPDKDAKANVAKLLLALEGKENREARFKTALSLALHNENRMFLGICEGSITQFPRGEGGFGYDPVFQPLGFEATFAQMSLAQKSEIGHRGKAMQRLLEYLLA